MLKCVIKLHVIIIYSLLIVCYEGEIRLLGGTAAQGTVELCAKNQWDTICGQLWSTNDAKMVCRQLQYNSSESSAL